MWGSLLFAANMGQGYRANASDQHHGQIIQHSAPDAKAASSTPSSGMAFRKKKVVPQARAELAIFVWGLAISVMFSRNCGQHGKWRYGSRQGRL